MKLFADLYLDEDVSVLIATLLQARGFNAVTARDEGMLTEDDPVQLAHAVALKRCIVTHNRDHFEQLHTAYVQAGDHHYGIIVAVRRTPYQIANRLVTLLNTLTADEVENQLLYI
jgi:predicted nuclease of predicted toxin-antitoxin system